jgi:hypothetical protein
MCVLIAKIALGASMRISFPIGRHMSGGAAMRIPLCIKYHL